MEAICDDIAAETAALGDIIAGLTDDQWREPTPAHGWNTRDTIIHVGAGDWAAALAVNEPDNFNAAKARLTSEGLSLEDATGAKFDAMSGAQLWEWFNEERAKMLAGFAKLDPKSRIPWFGPDMGARMFATARLMETWSHGHDIADTFAQPYPATDRLRNVAHICVVTRGWSYANRGEQMPAADVRVELSAPSGEEWTWGPDNAPDTVVGDAYDFCLAVTQRRHWTETNLTVTGDAARGWMDIAQAFAGPATTVERGRVD